MCCSILFQVILFAYWVTCKIQSAMLAYLLGCKDLDPWSIVSLVIILYRKFFVCWLSRVHVPPITFEHTNTFALQSLLFFLVAKTLVFVLLFSCLPCDVIAYLSSFVTTDFLGVWRIELTGRESEELHRMEKASDTLIILTPIFSICIMLRISPYCMIGSLLYCCCKTS